MLYLQKKWLLLAWSFRVNSSHFLSVKDRYEVLTILTVLTYFNKPYPNKDKGAKFGPFVADEIDKREAQR